MELHNWASFKAPSRGDPPSRPPVSIKMTMMARTIGQRDELIEFSSVNFPGLFPAILKQLKLRTRILYDVDLRISLAEILKRMADVKRFAVIPQNVSILDFVLIRDA